MDQPTTQKLAFSKEAQDEIERYLIHYPADRLKSAILPILHIAQAEFGGWVSPEAMDLVAEILKIQPIEVYEVATFYTVFNLKPVGKHVLEVCRTGPCMLRGSDQLIEHLENRLGCQVGENSADGYFTLKTVECLASCGTGPMLQIRENYYEDLTPEKMDALLNELKKS
jgi:NADH-quinone oxidoreductase subunit E